MTLDEKVLAEAKEIRGTLIDLETQAAHARMDYHAAIKKLHAVGRLAARDRRGARAVAPARPPDRRGPGRDARAAPGCAAAAGGAAAAAAAATASYFVARFDDGASEVMVDAQKEADSLKHNYVGTEHLMLAIVKRGHRRRHVRRGAQAGRRAVGEGDEPWIAGLPRPFTPRAKRVLEAALNDAADAGRRAVRPGRHPAGDRRPTRAESAARCLRDLGVTPERAARAARRSSRRGGVAAAVQPHEQRRCSCGCLGEQRPDPGVAADRALRRGRGRRGELGRVRGELGHLQRQVDRPLLRLLRARGEEVAVGRGVLARRAARPARRRRGRAGRGRRGRRCGRSGSSSRAESSMRARDRRPCGERLRRARRFGHSRRCRR